MIGKCAGGATVATLQGLIMLVLAPLVHVPYSPVMMVKLVVMMVITATMLTAFGLFLAARIQEIESFQVVMQLFVLPIFFLAGAVFPDRQAAPLARDADPLRPAQPTRSTRCAAPCSRRSTPRRRR